MTISRTFTERQLADRDSMIRGSGSQAAWMDILCRFSRQQREHLANLLAHNWTVSALEIQTAFSSTAVADERVVADRSCRDIFPNGPAHSPVQEPADLSATVAGLHAELKRLQSSLRFEKESSAETAKLLRQALSTYRAGGPNGLEHLLNAVEDLAVPA